VSYEALNLTIKMKTFIFIAITAILTLSLHPLEAAAKKGGQPQHKAHHKPTPEPTPVPKKIEASTASKIAKVGGDSITIECADKSTTYKMSKETQISVDGRHAAAGDLKAGMHAEIDASSLHPDLLLSIQATTAAKK